MIQVEGIFAGGSDSTKSYTLEVKTENPNSKADSVNYYSNESGTREKRSVYLTTSYQTITFCDGFLGISRGSGNITMLIDFYDSNDNKVISIDLFINTKYEWWLNPTGNMVLNIAYLLEEYPNIKKIYFRYMD